MTRALAPANGDPSGYNAGITVARWVHVFRSDGTRFYFIPLERTMSRTPSPGKSIADRLADILDRLIGGLAQPLRPAPVPVPVRRPGSSGVSRLRR
jgi:hypothetical protein